MWISNLHEREPFPKRHFCIESDQAGSDEGGYRDHQKGKATNYQQIVVYQVEWQGRRQLYKRHEPDTHAGYQTPDRTLVMHHKAQTQGLLCRNEEDRTLLPLTS
eukprot:527791-Pelagomonas_calceolata.AAC.9